MKNKVRKTSLGAWSDAGVCCMRNSMAALLLGLIAFPLVQAQTFSTLYNFSGGSDGGQPYVGVIQDPEGNLYGTTYQGGDLNCMAPYGCGAVYKLDTAGNETLLHGFTGSDGWRPDAPVIRDEAGNIYGTTVDGGFNDEGVVFKIDTAGKATVLHKFTGGSDGCTPFQGLVIGKSGALFGTTNLCGAYGYGTIFKIDNAGQFTLLHSFSAGTSDGASPYRGTLAMDKSGNLYGLTAGGGAYRSGVLYKLSESGKFTVLHTFNGMSDGCTPYGSVLRDRSGNLYGTTYGCGTNGVGVLWKVSKTGKESILHTFVYSPSDGCNPQDGVARDLKGNLYGVAGCGANKYGVLYELSAGGRFTLLRSFDESDGGYPGGEVLRTSSGTMLGTSSEGGTGNNGAVWSYVP